MIDQPYDNQAYIHIGSYRAYRCNLSWASKVDFCQWFWKLQNFNGNILNDHIPMCLYTESITSSILLSIWWAFVYVYTFLSSYGSNIGVTFRTATRVTSRRIFTYRSRFTRIRVALFCVYTHKTVWMFFSCVAIFTSTFVRTRSVCTLGIKRTNTRSKTFVRV